MTRIIIMTLDQVVGMAWRMPYGVIYKEGKSWKATYRPPPNGTCMFQIKPVPHWLYKSRKEFKKAIISFFNA
jgi:hypothetical protein